MPKRGYITFAAIILAANLSLSIPQERKGSLLSLLPGDERIQGWTMSDTARIYEGKDLFLFMDGGADLFFEYGFQRVLAAEYRNAAGKSVDLEMYEMNDPGASYGIYSVHSGQEATPLNIGQGGSAHAYYIMFWKGRYYVSIAGSDSTEECRGGLETIARAVDRNLLQEGERPPIVQSLPKASLFKQGYFRGYLGLSTLRAIDFKDMFHMIEGAFGVYGDHTLVVMRYGSNTEARQRLAEITHELTLDGQFKGSEDRDKIMKASDTRNQQLCFGQSGSEIVISVSPEASVALASCKNAMRAVRAR